MKLLPPSHPHPPRRWKECIYALHQGIPGMYAGIWVDPNPLNPPAIFFLPNSAAAVV